MRIQLARGKTVTVAAATAAVAAGLVWLVAGTPGPDWLRWTLGALLTVAVTAVAMAVLLGPVAHRMAGESRPLTARDRKRLTVKDRIDAVNNARATLLQAATGLVVVGGLLFTGAGLVYTARTLEVSARTADVSARTLDATREGQITDRYAKAVEQLGQAQIDVRLGGIYALQRLAGDSPRDKPTILNVLVAYVRVHAHPLKSQAVKGQALVDVAAALNVVNGLEPSPPRPFLFDLASADFHGLDMTQVKLPYANLTDAILNGTILTDANLTDANLTDAKLIKAGLAGAKLTDANLDGANLTSANLTHAYLERVSLLDRAILKRAILSDATLTDAYLNDADLREADLSGADLADAYLNDADLRSANLRGTNLTDADVRKADLRGADLTLVNLTGADLRGADLRSAYLRGVTGMTPAQIKAVAKTDATTMFG